MLTIAHLSDTHFGQYEGVADRTSAALAYLAALAPQPDVVLVTGDITNDGLPEQYAEAAATFARWQGAPLLFCPGNHDRRRPYAAWLGLPPGPCNVARRVGGVLFCMLDSLVDAPPGERIDEGLLTAESLAWLDEVLAAREPGERAVVCVHHPPADIHIGLMDPIKLVNGAELGRVLDRHAEIVCLLTGHAHTMMATTFAGVPWLIPGGLATTVTLDAEPWAAITPNLPPAVALHLLGDDGRLVTHWRTL